MDIERRYFTSPVEVRAKDDGAKMIRGHAAVFDSLSDNLGGFREKIAPGAFDGVLSDDVRALFNHDPNLILGRTPNTVRISVDKDGLLYEIDPPDTQLGRDLVVSMERGDITQSSFAFTVERDDWAEDDDGRVIRTIHEVKRLYDVSPVTYPAYPDAKVGLRGFTEYMNKRAEQRGIPLAVLYRELELIGV